MYVFPSIERTLTITAFRLQFESQLVKQRKAGASRQSATLPLVSKALLSRQ